MRTYYPPVTNRPDEFEALFEKLDTEERADVMRKLSRWGDVLKANGARTIGIVGIKELFMALLMFEMEIGNE